MKAITLPALLILSSLSYAQSDRQSDQMKLEKIKNNPSWYLEQGGAIEDGILNNPFKMSAEKHQDFVIYRSSSVYSPNDHEAEELKRLKHPLHSEGDDYDALKSRWIEQHQAAYDAMHPATIKAISEKERSTK